MNEFKDPVRIYSDRHNNTIISNIVVLFFFGELCDCLLFLFLICHPLLVIFARPCVSLCVPVALYVCVLYGGISSLFPVMEFQLFTFLFFLLIF